jgi:hypothetical protein
MAGGPNAASIACLICFRDTQQLVEAKRTAEGMENDQYVCEKSHKFGVDWRRGAPKTPQWPPGPEFTTGLKK